MATIPMHSSLAVTTGANGRILVTTMGITTRASTTGVDKGTVRNGLST